MGRHLARGLKYSKWQASEASRGKDVGGGEREATELTPGLKELPTVTVMYTIVHSNTE